MPEFTGSEDYHIAFIPTAPYLDWMKTGVCLKAVKSFENTHIVPDFSPLLAENWTEEKLKALKKPIRIDFNRYVPPGALIHLIVNFETPLSGELVRMNPGEQVYKVMDGPQLTRRRAETRGHEKCHKQL
jgi:hypothetical protein